MTKFLLPFLFAIASNGQNNWGEPFPAHKIAGNLYYVGTAGLASYLVVTPQGNILINSSLETSVPMIKASIEKLGFSYADTKILLTSHAHWDHNAGSAAIKEQTGAKYMVMAQDVAVTEDGGKSDFMYGSDASTHYKATKVDHALRDGEQVKLGGAVLTAHLTAGHTKGCTTWTMKISDGGKSYDVVIVGSPNANEGYKLIDNAAYPGIAQDFERTFKTLRALHCDIFLGAHGDYYGMKAKYARMTTGGANVFVDPQGYAAYIADRERAYLRALAAQKPVAGNRVSGNLEIYWIDAEGGAATLIVSPGGESMLVDTANRTRDDRDAKRIMAAVQMAGLTKIDILLTTHFHGDHIGAMEALAKLIPIGMYLDHGDSVELARPNIAAAYQAYVALAGSHRRILKAGDKIPLKGVEIDVVMSAGQGIAEARKGAGAKNAACDDYKEKAPEGDPDNDQSVGFVLKYGKFDFIDMGDLSWNYEPKLTCPANLIGKVDLYQTTHHGLDRSNSPQFVWAIAPTVAVMNNGPRKGGQASVFETLRKSPGLQDIWQGHLALGTPVEVNSGEQMIANLEATAECKGNLLKASVDAKGQFTMTNLRNGFSKSYSSK